MIPFQVIYRAEDDNPNEFHWLWKEEALTLRKMGVPVETYANPESTSLMFRGGSNLVEVWYNQDGRFINRIEHMRKYLYMSEYLPPIADLSIETFFVDELNETVLFELEKRGWEKAFIKKDTKALEHVEDGKSIWPVTSLEEMTKLYEEMKTEGKYAIRKFIEKDIIDQEERYWVLNGNIYHRSNQIPEVVKKAAERLNKLGSRYYTIDATPEFVVEVNPGESSDRHAVNSPELFASWIKKEFC
jgi:hypothetical protein